MPSTRATCNRSAWIQTRLPVPMNGATYMADVMGGQKTGLFFPNKDKPALVNALVKITENESLRSKFGAEALNQFNKRFSYQKMQAAFGDIYTKLCK